jgi:hypothetical protein
MAIHATHLAAKDWVSMWQAHLSPLVEMALKTGLRRLSGIDNRSCLTCSLDVNASRAVAGFA